MNTRRLGLASLVLPVALIAGSGSVQAGITNGGFEAGDLTGWTASPTSLVSVVQTVAGPWYNNIGDPTDPIKPFLGTYFAQLNASLNGADIGVYTMLSQAFSVSVGDKLSFAAYFATEEDTYIDDGYVKLLGVGANAGFELVMFSATSDPNDPNSNQLWTGWQTADYTFITAGQYQIEAGVRNVEPTPASVVGGPSQLGLDAVTLTTAPPPTGVPEPMSLAIWSVGGVALLIGEARRRRQLMKV